ALAISPQAAQQWLTSINSFSFSFRLVWRNSFLMHLLTLIAIGWMLLVLIIDFDRWLAESQIATATLIGLAALISLSSYWLIDRFQGWREVRLFSHGLLWLMLLMLVLQLPVRFEFYPSWSRVNWLMFGVLLVGSLVVGQLWLKRWFDETAAQSPIFDNALWLAAGILMLAAAVHYGLPDSDSVMTVLIPAIVMLAGLWFSYRSNKSAGLDQRPLNAPFRPLYWYDWQGALLDCATIFVPILLLWVLITNAFFDGRVWDITYFPLINLFDITCGSVLLFGLGAYYLSEQRKWLNSSQASSLQAVGANNQNVHAQSSPSHFLLTSLGLIGFWVISSMLVRTLHTYAGTPLWMDNAWGSELVQTGLTILWTLLALVATILASRYQQRLAWFMGIGLLGLVVLKLVLVDLSQTEAIWRVISFIGAGSLILLIGYLAPLPPAHQDSANTE
ncbi:MAG: DUF2339 domain-containing protein, partial [Psychrobacter sp.]|nr:DUF2339 domain-containing protein [Psychrobacter sp.]